MHFEIYHKEMINAFVLLIQRQKYTFAYTHRRTHVYKKTHTYQANKKTMINYLAYFYND